MAEVNFSMKKNQENPEDHSLELFKEVSAKYYEYLAQGDPEFPLNFLTYDFSVNSKELVWEEYEKEFTRTIINVFNDFSACLYRLHILEKIISQYDNDSQDALALRTEFIHIPLHYCLNKPYEFSGRIQYCCILLCDSANHTVHNFAHDFKQRERYGIQDLKDVSKKWKSRERLLQALKLVGNYNLEFKNATENYRDRSQHQLPSKIDIGLTNLVKKKIVSADHLPEIILQAHNITSDQKLVSFVFGGDLPLKTEDMISVLVQQGEEMRNLFYRYWDLVLEQSEAVNKKLSYASEDART